MYVIKNLQTNRVLIHERDLNRVKHLFGHIPARKNGELILQDLETGEILKIKKAKKDR